MPRYTTQVCFQDAEEFPFFPCDVMDANGRNLHLPGVYVDTDTGVVIYAKLDKEGNTVHFGGVVSLIVEVHPAPLKIVPFDAPDEPFVRG